MNNCYSPTLDEIVKSIIDIKTIKLTILKSLDEAFLLGQQFGRMSDGSLDLAQVTHRWNP